MISLEELTEIKEKRKTKLYYEEKEYFQFVFLHALSRFSEDFFFKGGTCLRICFGSERASEDLNFNTNLSTLKIKSIFLNCLKDFELLNIPFEVYAEKKLEGNIRFEVRFKGPLFQGGKESTNTLKVDFNSRKIKKKAVKIISKLFSDVPQFSIVVMDEEEILAEKIRTLLRRIEPRDLYDVWMLLNKGTRIDVALLKSKLKEEKVIFTHLKFPWLEEYNRDLQNLLSIVPPYEQVTREIERAFKSINLN
ncbi:nucleotidyl transferase AbiEii/AbiGii toxin family protein [Candidatus Woesearchaeota archaeon]|nr:nucleotidyl transferase AbiEii/AbiGii toxin family protein [Candidatus Woesearchaeota archaeon]